jgi:tRNA U34 2-thiouridine synthase MnmA/TrmU
MRALILFSGGLDSMIVAKILVDIGFDVTGVVFTSYFFNAKKAQESAKEINLKKLLIKNFAKKHLTIVKNPKYGYGRGLNPCIDCHKLMIAEAKKIFEKEEYDVFATGETLNQRPFSQSKIAFNKIERDVDFEGKILRLLSAKLLPETIYEKKGIINRKYFFDVQGKSRKKTIEIAKECGIENFPSPAGGCSLTELLYSEKIERLLRFKKQLDIHDFQLLISGRQFWVDDLLAHIILGRNYSENVLIEKLRKKGEILIKRNDEKGPTALIQFSKTKNKRKIKMEIIKKAKELIWKHSSKKPDSYLNLKYITYNK